MPGKLPYWLLLMPLLLLYQCLEPLDPESIAFENFLVVEALITDEPIAHQVRLSRTAPIDQANPIPETGARVRLENEQGTVFPFRETEPGVYALQLVFAAVIGSTYQLFIETSDGKEYQSSKIKMIETPAIASIYTEFEPNENENTGIGG